MAPDGYVYEFCPTHPHALYGMVKQHRLVMECHLGRFLERKERVHHRNKRRWENTLDNLELYSSQAEHMRDHWARRGRRDRGLIAQVLAAAVDPTVSVADLPCSPTTTNLICKEHGVKWVARVQYRNAALLTEQSVREALQGRTTQEAAAHLGVAYMTLYRRFGHLLTKRTSPRKRVWDAKRGAFVLPKASRWRKQGLSHRVLGTQLPLL